MFLWNLTLSSWPKANRYNIHLFSRCLRRDNLAAMQSFLAIKQASLLNIVLLNMPQFRTQKHFSKQGLLIRTKYSYHEIFEQKQKRDIAIFAFHMGVNSIRTNKLWPLVPRLLNKKGVNMFGQLLGVCSSGLIWLTQGHFMIFVSVRDLFVKGKKV